MNTQESEKQGFKGSKGKFGTELGSNGLINSIDAYGVFFTDEEDDDWSVCAVWKDVDDDKEVSKYNAELIVEAFNVVTETGMTPRQLQDKVKELETQLHSEKTDAFNYQCESGVYQKANEKLQQQNDKMRNRLFNILAEAEESIEQLKTQDNE